MKLLTQNVPTLGCSGKYLDAEWSRQVFFAHFFCNTTCHPPACALPQCLTAIVINSWDICIPAHAFLHYMLIFCNFCSLPNESQVPDSLLTLCSKAGLFCSFLLQCIVPPTCLCCSV